MVVVVCGSLVLAWLTRSALEQFDHLQKEHAAVSGETFYLGVTLRGSIRSLSEKLVRLGHDSNPTAREEFLRESAEVGGWLTTNRLQLVELAKLPLLKRVLIDDFDILDRIQLGYEVYLTQAAALLNTVTNQTGSPSFEERFALVHEASSKLILLCDEMVKAQREDFRDFLAETQVNLVNHQRLLKVTLTLVVALAGALAVLVYRGMIAPLQLGLTQSRGIIERQEKLASLGVLASGVAHEIRNPLTAIKFRLFSLKQAFPALVQNEDASIVSNEINRLERIVRDFLKFARPSEPELEDVPAERMVREACDLLKGPLERLGIFVKPEILASSRVQADAQQIKQVLINLIQNSAEAIGRDGSITVQLREEVVELEDRPQPVAVLAVVDNGKGISPEVEARLFDPFFTTKEGGTGLGLAVAEGIVEKHGGMLRYETEMNRGTSFELVLPRVEPNATKVTADRR